MLLVNCTSVCVRLVCCIATDKLNFPI